MKTKHVIATALVALMTSAAWSQDISKEEVPSVVLNAFNVEFKNVTDVEWEKETDTTYEVDFETDGIEYEALLQDTGKILQYKKEMQFNALPEKLKTTVTSKYPKLDKDDVYLLVIDTKQYYLLEDEGIFSSSNKIFTEAGEEVTGVAYYE